MKDANSDGKGGGESPATANRDRYLATAIASALMEGLTLNELKNLHAIMQLITYNIQSEIALRALLPVSINNNNNKI